ncbi:hypothetical protein N7537_010897 [Penicillium hordei]|uniref:Uncharacterized protein n=1 Tax=Penicillium hordei TaxID=40994 RepID=A0AAD6DM94_9EURO|nr:uncharacterized protein N7537_010897 [Penicillium hordei]KAJ5588219.1 hypothetical protein N7537_010897 [Penicillium hordei]
MAPATFINDVRTDPVKKKKKKKKNISCCPPYRSPHSESFVSILEHLTSFVALEHLDSGYLSVAMPGTSGGTKSFLRA